MPAPLSIPAESVITKRSGAILVYTFNYDDALASGVQLATAGVVTIAPNDGRLTQDGLAFVTGNRGVVVRLTAGKVQKRYRITHLAATNETPSQTPAPWFDLVITP